VSDDSYKWYVWRNYGTPDQEWKGFIKNEQTYFEWVKTQEARGRNMDDFVCNNVAPPKDNHRAFDTEGVVAPVRRSRKARTAPVKAQPKPADTKEMKDLRKAAAVRLDEHKAAEAADMAAGK
jgi:hypothetical protein